MFREQHYPPDLRARHWEDVLSATESLIQQHADPVQRPLFELALRALDRPSPNNGLLTFSCKHIPLHVYAALHGDDTAAVPLTAALVLLGLGIDLLDDMADGDLPPDWSVYRPSEINLAAMTLIAALPQLALADLDAPPATIVAMQRTLARGCMRISAGQHRDLAFAGATDVTVEEVEASVTGKWGEVVAMFAALAAQCAGACPEVVEAYETLGRTLGTGWQFAEDCYDLFTAPRSRDLGNGVRTLPIVLYLERQTGTARMQFLDLLEQARTDIGAQAAVRHRLRAAGVLRHCAFIIEVYCQRARRLLEQVQAQDPGRGGILHMIATMSFFSHQRVERR